MNVNTDLSQVISSARILPEQNASEFYQFHSILSPNSEKLLYFYDQCAISGEFLFPDEIHSYLDNL